MNRYCSCGGRINTARYSTLLEKVPNLDGLWWHRKIAVFYCATCGERYIQRLRMPANTCKFALED